MSNLRDKLPEVAIEGLFVVFAILLALAADEWRESRQNEEISERALQGIEEEMRANRMELMNSREPNLDLLGRLQAAVGDGRAPDGVDIQFEYSLLSAAAWQTAQVTQAIHYADYNLIQEIARLYDLQDLFVENQRSMVSQLAGLRGTDTQFVEATLGHLSIVMGVEAGYMAVLDTMIVQMENR